MGLDMSLDLKPKQDLELLKEIVTYNRWKYKQAAAKKALSGDLIGFGLLVSSDSFFSHYYTTDDPMVLEEVEKTVEKSALLAFKAGKTTQDPELLKIVEEILPWMEQHAEAEEPHLSQATIQYMKDHPEYQEIYYSDSVPDKENEFDAELMKRFSLYWRKQNHIHSWFVENVQDGEDDCGSYVVSKEKLIEFKEVLQKAVKAYVDQYKDHEQILYEEELEAILPTQGGFFFGSTNYDEWYNQANEETLKDISRALEEVDFDKYMFVYSSSW